jgi:8-hydroxy-5-deazaflavin:NADPH oxidoreductase
MRQQRPVVKAANTLSAEVLSSDSHQAGGQRVILSGDDAAAKSVVAALFEDAGFAVVDLGDLATGGEMQQIHHPLAGLNLIRLG